MPHRIVKVTLLLLIAIMMLGDPALASGAKKKTSDEGGHGGAAEPEIQRFIELDALNAPIISNRRVRGHMELYLVIEIKDEEMGPEVMRKLPRLEASFVQVANNYAASLGLPTKRLDIGFVMRGLQAEADRLFPPGTIAVLVQQAQYRR